MNYSSNRHIVWWGKPDTENGKPDTDTDINFSSDEDNSYEMSFQLYHAVKTNDLEKYKLLFDRYIHDSTMCSYFEYDWDLHPGMKFTVYPHCTCANRGDYPIKMHRHFATRACTCINGKYYLALQNAYKALIDGAFDGWCLSTVLDYIKKPPLPLSPFSSSSQQRAIANPFEILVEEDIPNDPVTELDQCDIIIWLKSLQGSSVEVGSFGEHTYALDVKWENEE